MVASLRDWSSPLFEWNVCRGDHWSPVCVIEIHREPPLGRQCRQLSSRGALRNLAGNKKPPIEGRWHEERVTEGWLLAKSKIKYGYIQNCKQMRWCCYLKICKQKGSQSTAFKLT